MTVYYLNNMTIHDEEAYRTYVAAFLPVFLKHGGTVLAAQDAPPAIEGTWAFDRTVLLGFPTREAAERWYHSDEYKAIAKYRLAGTVSNVTMLEGLPGKPPTADS